MFTWPVVFSCWATGHPFTCITSKREVQNVGDVFLNQLAGSSSLGAILIYLELKGILQQPLLSCIQHRSTHLEDPGIPTKVPALMQAKGQRGSWGPHRCARYDMVWCILKFSNKKMRTIPKSSTTKAANGNLHASNLSRTAGSLEKIRARLLGMNLRSTQNFWSDHSRIFKEFQNRWNQRNKWATKKPGLTFHEILVV